MGLGDLSGGISRSSSAQSSYNDSYSTGYSNTYGAEASSASAQEAEKARQWQAQQAELNRQFQREMFEKEMQFNREEAQKSRDYTQAQVDVANEMANTVYTRSANNMKEAGINPILAYSMGLSGAGNGSVSSAGQASVGGSPSGSMPNGFMAQTFADQHSASNSTSHGEGSGSSWMESQNGLATGLQMLGQALGDAISNMQSGGTINYMMGNLGKEAKSTWNDIKQMMIENLPNSVVKAMGLNYDASSTTQTTGRKKTVTGSYNFGKNKNSGGSSGGGRKF